VDDGGVAAGKQYWRSHGHGQGSGGSYLKVVGAIWAPSVRETGTRGPHGFDFSNLSKIGSIWKSKKECLILLQKFPNFE
jgi:hypothetical protein